MSDHSFNPFIAKKYNINVAILLNSFVFWTRTNSAKEENFHEDRFWCFGTPEYFSKYFPYFTIKQIKYALQQAIEFELLIKSNFNKKGYDRTSWYSLSDKALIEFNLDRTCLKPAPFMTNLSNESQQGLYEEIMLETQSSTHLTNLDNARDKFVLTIPTTKPSTKQNIKTLVDSKESTKTSPSSSQAKDYLQDARFMSFYSIYPRREKPRDAWKAFKSLKIDGALLERILADVKDRTEHHTPWSDKQYIPLPASYLRSAAYDGEIFNEQEEVRKKVEAAKLEAKKRESEQEVFTQKQEREVREKKEQYNKDGAAFRNIVSRVLTKSGLDELAKVRQRLGMRES
jgi:hypothetical protein